MFGLQAKLARKKEQRKIDRALITEVWKAL